MPVFNLSSNVGGRGFGLLGGGKIITSLLLDSYSATSAYGLRKLKTVYAGPCLRLRRSSDNAESDFGFASDNYLDLSAISAWKGADTVYVTKWYDQVGANNLTQATTTKQPELELNVQHHGFLSASIKYIASIAKCLTCANVPIGIYSISSVFKSANDAVVYEHGIFAENNPGNYLYTTYNYASTVRRGTTVTSRRYKVSWANDNKYRATTQLFDGTNAGNRLFVGGKEISLSAGGAANDPGTSTVTLTLNVGSRNNAASAPMNGYVDELILFPSVIQDSDIRTIATSEMLAYGGMAHYPVKRWGVARENSYINGKIYVTNGMDTNTFFDTCYEFDISKNTWTQRANSAHVKDGASQWTYNGKLYVFGGRDSTATPIGLNYVEEYDPAADTWISRTPLPQAAADSGACGFDDNGTYKIFVVGGYTSGPNARLNKCQLYYPATDTWETVSPPANMPDTHNSPAVCLLDGFIYVFGGFGSLKVHKYEIATNTWFTMADLSAPFIADYNLMAAADTDRHEVHIFYFGTHFLYNTANDTYISKSPTLAGGAWRNMTYHDGIIYATCNGLAGATPGAQAEKYYCAEDVWIHWGE